MARHREHDSDAEPAEVLGLDPLATYRPLKQRGPATTLTEPLGLALCRHIAAGRFLRDAAVLAGTSDSVVQGWLRRGREDIEANEQTLYTWFTMEYEAASAHFRRALEELVLANIGNRSLLEKFIRWRLSISDPKHYTLPRVSAAPTAGNNLGPLFELVTPEQARNKLDEKLERFLEEHDKFEAAVAAPPADGESGEDDDGC
ncbi:hypothetical protein FJV41_46535 [Myxococcus llanfairpwllgwyngyllgogerychwyrndrobwllllantysiliogogogochensis]|uniref:Uncharacterized protein n=1 Tax=Myxococcus llanfairpwllgwyngyllgogerychwyrndrobwllllantysiliogogogochensis TaxID=2590453 RepID=A0A540WJ79_9BACT|nr:hypothetical protein [Myxococcus llanfairpwllgwyngyllgogerychwyrndrobwllllantysiliogogogochensis]TQF09076.1 hypothetical protein FJV41_46535 [Myxococcus llanfairpwllgwyngyllgogerychwyrndrobwllllantysiliogogogochensis]